QGSLCAPAGRDRQRGLLLDRPHVGPQPQHVPRLQHGGGPHGLLQGQGILRQRHRPRKCTVPDGCKRFYAPSHELHNTSECVVYANDQPDAQPFLVPGSPQLGLRVLPVWIRVAAGKVYKNSLILASGLMPHPH
ncbi:unnamed protein product, partial [Ixodes pacificus]